MDYSSLRARFDCELLFREAGFLAGLLEIFDRDDRDLSPVWRMTRGGKDQPRVSLGPKHFLSHYSNTVFFTSSPAYIYIP